jgi:hypothetical protein
MYNKYSRLTEIHRQHLTASRPDIMFSVCMCARFQAAPKECHLPSVNPLGITSSFVHVSFGV